MTMIELINEYNWQLEKQMNKQEAIETLVMMHIKAWIDGYEEETDENE